MRGLGFFLFARRYLGNTYLFLFLLVLRCFTSQGLLSELALGIISVYETGFPHSEISGSKVALHLPEAYRSNATSFFATFSQGIHRTPLNFLLRNLKTTFLSSKKILSRPLGHQRFFRACSCLQLKDPSNYWGKNLIFNFHTILTFQTKNRLSGGLQTKKKSAYQCRLFKPGSKPAFADLLLGKLFLVVFILIGRV